MLDRFSISSMSIAARRCLRGRVNYACY